MYTAFQDDGELLIFPLNEDIKNAMRSIPGTGFDTLLQCARVPDSLLARTELQSRLGAKIVFQDKEYESSPLTLEGYKLDDITLPVESDLNKSSRTPASSEEPLFSWVINDSQFKQAIEVIESGIREYAIDKSILDPADNAPTHAIVGTLSSLSLIDRQLKALYFALKGIRNILAHPRNPYINVHHRLLAAGKPLLECLEVCLQEVNLELYQAVERELRQELQ
jgi:hypothetical protein